MRTFKNYAPRQIAKHVSAFFKGQFEIAEQGTFEFDGGKVVVDASSNAQQRRIGKEVNRVIAGFMAGRASRAAQSYC